MDLLEIYQNSRTEDGGFDIKHSCSFCDKNHIYLMKIPNTDKLICKSCLCDYVFAIDRYILIDVGRR